jgi:hypothetical protein
MPWYAAGNTPTTGGNGSTDPHCRGLRPGLAVGLLIGAVLGFGVVGLVRTPQNERGTFDPVPNVEHDHSLKAPS